MMEDERNYVNCLMTSLARGTAKSVILAEGLPLPDPAQLTSDPNDLHWIEGFGFNLQRLSTAFIIGFIVRAAGFRWYRFRTNEGTIAAILPRDGEPPRKAEFRVTRRLSAGHLDRTEIEITPVPNNESTRAS